MEYHFVDACRFGSMANIERILRDSQHQTKHSPDYNIGFIHACMNGRVDVVRRLLVDDRIDPAGRDNDSLRRTIDRNWGCMDDDTVYVAIAKLLLQQPSVLFSIYMSGIGGVYVRKARMQWYADRAHRFNELHTELVATVAVNNRKN